MGPKVDILNNTVLSSVNIMKELLLLDKCDMQTKSKAINLCK